MASKPSKINIVFIGNSITQGVLLPNPMQDAPPTKAIEYLRGKGLDVDFANRGFSGATTVDFLPISQRYFPRVIKAADTFYEQNGTLIFSISLGTNDSAITGPTGAPVEPAQYRKNMQIIIDDLLVRYPSSYIVIHQPTWYSPNTHNGAIYLEEGLTRLQKYTSEQDELISLNPARVLKGDRKASNSFKKNPTKLLTPENGNSGTFYLHPNKEGAQTLGVFWGKNLYENIHKLKKTNL